MVRVSNTLIAIVNFLALLCSVAIVGFSVWFYFHPGSICQKVLQMPLLILGGSIFVVSLLGLIVGVLCFMVFSIVVTNKGVGKAITRRGSSSTGWGITPPGCRSM